MRCAFCRCITPLLRCLAAVLFLRYAIYDTATDDAAAAMPGGCRLFSPLMAMPPCRRRRRAAHTIRYEMP